LTPCYLSSGPGTWFVRSSIAGCEVSFSFLLTGADTNVAISSQMLWSFLRQFRILKYNWIVNHDKQSYTNCQAHIATISVAIVKTG
jgi:hypothetical protein